MIETPEGALALKCYHAKEMTGPMKTSIIAGAMERICCVFAKVCLTSTVRTVAELHPPCTPDDGGAGGGRGHRAPPPSGRLCLYLYL